MSKPSIADVVYRLLISSADVVALVDHRIFPEVAPSGTEDPWLVYQQIGNSVVTSHSGYDDLDDVLFQLSGWSQDATKRKMMRNALLSLFRCWSGELDGYTVLVMHQDDRDETEDGPPRLYGVQMDILVSL